MLSCIKIICSNRLTVCSKTTPLKEKTFFFPYDNILSKMSSPISPFYRPGVFPALSSRLLISASQTLRLSIHSQQLLRSFYNAPLCLTDLPLTATKGFTYLIAASWHPKRKRHSAVNAIPSGGGHRWWAERKKAGKVDAGDDAFFYVGTNNGVALGVADGVGGWSQVKYYIFL